MLKLILDVVNSPWPVLNNLLLLVIIVNNLYLLFTRNTNKD